MNETELALAKVVFGASCNPDWAPTVDIEDAMQVVEHFHKEGRWYFKMDSVICGGWQVYVHDEQAVVNGTHQPGITGHGDTLPEAICEAAKGIVDHLDYSKDQTITVDWLEEKGFGLVSGDMDDWHSCGPIHLKCFEDHWRIQVGGTEGMWEFFPNQTKDGVLAIMAALGL